MSKKKEIFISAGESSGDILAAGLINAIHQYIGNCRFFGLTGTNMVDAGVESIASIDGLQIMGFFEILSKISEFKILEKDILAEIDRRQPKLAILVDYPGFHFQLAEQLKIRGIPVVQYVAPKLWAWGGS